MKVRPTSKSGPAAAAIDAGDATRPNRAASVSGASASLAQIKRILVPVDFSPRSREALGFALPFARQFGASVIVLHVILPYAPVDPNGLSLPDPFVPDLEQNAKRQLEELVRETVPAEIPSQVLVRRGRPANEIIQASGELRADLIIIPTHGQTGLKQVVFGSTAERVIRHANCPVLVVRGKEHPLEE